MRCCDLAKSVNTVGNLIFSGSFFQSLKSNKMYFSTGEHVLQKGTVGFAKVAHFLCKNCIHFFRRTAVQTVVMNSFLTGSIGEKYGKRCDYRHTSAHQAKPFAKLFMTKFI